MNTKLVVCVVLAVCSLLISTCWCKKWEEPITSSYTSTLNAGQVTSGSNSAATGTGTFFYNARTETLSWRITHNVQNALTADLHGPAAAGQDSTRKPVVSFPSATSPIQGSAKISDENAVQLMNDLMYVIIHTANNPLGEIRGQVLLAEIEGIVKGKASLSGDKVVEPNTPGKGTGTFTFKFSNLTRVMNWTLEHNVKNASMAHIHGPATAQENGAVLLAFDSPSDAKGSFVITDAVEQFLLNGLLYAAVHGPDGEIRGQLDITSVKLGTDNSGNDDGLSGGAVFGIILAVLIAIALAAFLAYFLYQRSQSGQTFQATAASPSHRDRSGGMGVSLLDDAQPV